MPPSYPTANPAPQSPSQPSNQWPNWYQAWFWLSAFAFVGGLIAGVALFLMIGAGGESPDYPWNALSFSIYASPAGALVALVALVIGTSFALVFGVPLYQYFRSRRIVSGWAYTLGLMAAAAGVPLGVTVWNVYEYLYIDRVTTEAVRLKTILVYAQIVFPFFAAGAFSGFMFWCFKIRPLKNGGAAPSRNPTGQM
ncbi:MAG: hypothetical protein HQ511_05710 [Rhodospirillales bacterium]|nr:hypothetical protein [Rhodospirillales bacterium]